MKKLFTLMFLIIFAGISFAQSDNAKSLKAFVQKNMDNRGFPNVEITVEELKKLDNPAGFSLFKVVFVDKGNAGMPPNEQFLFYDGKFMTQDFIELAKGGASLASEIAFDMSKTDIDIKKLSLIHGKKGAKNTIVKVSDFECPYCRRANAYLEDKIKGKDVAVYIMHYPLEIHPNAVILAKIFEAGLKMNKNFGHELFSDETLLGKNEADLVEIFAAQSGNAAKFKTLVKSKEVEKQVEDSKKYADKLGIRATPVLFVNGRKIEGFNAALIDRALSGF